MRILRVSRRLVKLVFLGLALLLANAVSFNYLLENGGIVDIVDIWSNSHIERAALSQTMEGVESADLKWLEGKVIAIDPGHGGVDNGAVRYGHDEKDLNLEIASKLAAVLRASGATVILTREGDIDYYTKGRGGKRNDLLKRAQIIKDANAQIFVSIHCNSMRGSSWTGAQVFYNAAVPENKEMAQIMQEALKNFPVGNKRQARQDSNIFLLKSINIPGVLIETGFISNRKEARALSEDEYQKKLADAVAKGLAYYFSQNQTR